MIYSVNSKRSPENKIEYEHKHEFLSDLEKKEFDYLLKILKKNGVEYSKLKNALVPNLDKREIILAIKQDNPNFGYKAFEQIYKFLKLENSHAIVYGYLAYNDFSGDRLKMFKFFEQEMDEIISMDIMNTQEFFLIYINNLEYSQIRKLVYRFINLGLLIGYKQASVNSRMKTTVSEFSQYEIQCDGNIIKPYPEGDGFDSDDGDIGKINNKKIIDYGYRVIFVRRVAFDLFLSPLITDGSNSPFKHDEDMIIEQNEETTIIIPNVLIEDPEIIEKIENKLGKINPSDKEKIKEILKNVVLEKFKNKFLFEIEKDVEKDSWKMNTFVDIRNFGKRAVCRFGLALEFDCQKKILKIKSLFGSSKLSKDRSYRYDMMEDWDAEYRYR